jgi:hypothetical protein
MPYYLMHKTRKYRGLPVFFAWRGDGLSGRAYQRSLHYTSDPDLAVEYATETAAEGSRDDWEVVVDEVFMTMVRGAKRHREKQDQAPSHTE